MSKETNEIFPRALMVAARTFADRPKVVGEILVALAVGTNPHTMSLTEVQSYILAECKEEIAELRAKRDAKRQAWAEKKRRQRQSK